MTRPRFTLQVCAWCLIALVVSPFTAPYSVMDLSEWLGRTREANVPAGAPVSAEADATQEGAATPVPSLRRPAPIRHALVPALRTAQAARVSVNNLGPAAAPAPHPRIHASPVLLRL